jgi:hypothetical protein
MSDTPRTDAALMCELRGTAEKLERELAAAKGEIERLQAVAKQALEALEGFVYHGRSNIWTQAITGLLNALKEPK